MFSLENMEGSIQRRVITERALSWLKTQVYISHLYLLSALDLYSQVWQWEVQEGHSVCEGKGGICAS